MVAKLLITGEAKRVLDTLKKDHGPLIFHQSGGCCDGSAPICLLKDEFQINEADVHLGKVNECDFFMSIDQYQYWKHTQLILDAVPGRGSGFSLEAPLGIRFITRSRMFSNKELEWLVYQNHHGVRE